MADGMVEYIARLTCACGKTVELPAEVEVTSGCSCFGGPPCTAELSFNSWTGGFRGDNVNAPIECDACGDARLDRELAKKREAEHPRCTRCKCLLMGSVPTLCWLCRETVEGRHG